MVITSAGSAEIFAVSSILTCDFYYESINQGLKLRREGLRQIWFGAEEGIVVGGKEAISVVNTLMGELVEKSLFGKPMPTAEVAALAAAIGSFTVDGQIAAGDLYSALIRAV